MASFASFISFRVWLSGIDLNWPLACIKKSGSLPLQTLPFPSSTMQCPNQWLIPLAPVSIKLPWATPGTRVQTAMQYRPLSCARRVHYLATKIAYCLHVFGKRNIVALLLIVLPPLQVYRKLTSTHMTISTTESQWPNVCQPKSNHKTSFWKEPSVCIAVF